MEVEIKGLPERLAARIRAEGPLNFEQWVEACLYDPHDGFYSSGGSAGRRGDFITSPEVGPLFGTVLANWIDNIWANLGSPKDFVVLEAGAGPGTLARSILGAKPKSLIDGRYITIERSEIQQKLHPEEAETLSAFPKEPITGVVIANELLDNLPFRLCAGNGEKWTEILITEEFQEIIGNEVELPFSLLPLPEAKIPIQTNASDWVQSALDVVRQGAVLAIDYCSTTSQMAREPQSKWLRTYRGHKKGTDPKDTPGTQDITVDVALDQLPSGFQATTQAEFLTSHGIEELVKEGRRIWEKQAHLGGLEAVKARSRITEAEALLDPNGLGGFTTLEWLISY